MGAQFSVGSHVRYDPVGDFLVRADVEFLPVGAADAGIFLPLLAVVLLLSFLCGFHALVELRFLQPQSLTGRITLGEIFRRGQGGEASNFGLAEGHSAPRASIAIVADLLDHGPISGIVGGVELPGRDLLAGLPVLLRPCGRSRGEGRGASPAWTGLFRHVEDRTGSDSVGWIGRVVTPPLGRS